MTAVQSLRPTARPLASEKKFCMAHCETRLHMPWWGE